MILSPERMADIRKYSKNVQERNVIETLDARIFEMQKAMESAYKVIDMLADNMYDRPQK